MKKKSLKTAALVLSIVGILGAGGIMAYLTDTDSATNTFNMKKVDITEEETGWTEPEEVTPNMVITKDPTVANIGDVPVFVFQTVSVPVANVVVAKEDGTRLAQADTELFSFTANPGWYLMGTRNIMGEGAYAANVVAREYLYAYGTNAKMTALPETAGQNRTPALFNNVKYANVIEGSVDNKGNSLSAGTQVIDVKAYGIQTTDVNGNITDPAGIWAVYTNQNGITNVYN